MRRCPAICVLFALPMVLAAASSSRAAEPQSPEELPRMAAPAGHYLGSLSCASASCHGRQDEKVSTGSVTRQEYAVWLEHDPHAQAARTLDSPAFQRILSVVSSGRAEGKADPQVYLRCAQCHDPLGATSPDPVAFQPVSRGIGCESCHGPAKDWIAVHYERDVSRERLVELGMIDTKNLAVRAEQCAGCHVGDTDKDMNHDMIAAGHPPLRFELSAYHDLIRQKHWPPAERIRTPEFKAQLWAAGQVAVARSTLALLESRAQRAAAGDKHTPWPEFAEYDCFACHQRLRPATGYFGVALKGAKPGIPGWQPWNLALVERLLDGGPKSISLVRQQMSGSLLTDPAIIQQLAATAHKHLEHSPLPAAPFTTANLLAFLKPAIQQDSSWAARSQQLLALRAADLATRDERLRLHPPAEFVSLSSGREECRRQPIDDWDRDWRSVSAALQFGSAGFEWPAFDWEGLPHKPPLPIPTDSNSIAAELRRLTQKLVESSQPGRSESNE
jgi:hypothetical protein